MNAQLAEHDAYFATNLLARASLRDPTLAALVYPGLAEECLLLSLNASRNRLAHPPVSY